LFDRQPSTSQPVSQAANPPGMPDYANMTIQQLRAAMDQYALRHGGRAFMIQRLTELYRAQPNAVPAIAKSRTHPLPLDTATQDRITAILKKSHLYENMLLYIAVDLKEVQRVIAAENIKVTLQQLSDYLTAQGAIFTKPKREAVTEES